MLLRLSLLSVWQDKSLPEFRLMIAALWITVLSITTLMTLSHAIRELFVEQAAQLLGADLMLESTEPLSQIYQGVAVQRGVSTTPVVEFFSMLIAKEEYQLGLISAISDPFPLRGKLGILTAKGIIQTQSPPPAGELWMQEELAQKLKIKLNDSVQVGEAQLRLTGILQAHPIAMSSSSSFAPLVYVNAQDLNKMAVIQPGSRITYRLLLAANANQLEGYKKHFSNTPTPVTWVSPNQGRIGIKETLTVAGRYLAVILLIQIFLAGSVMAMCTHQYGIGQQKKVALWRSLGASSHFIIKIQVISLLIPAFLVIMIAVVMGLSSAKLFLFYGQYFELPQGELGWAGALWGALTGLLMVMSFVLGPLLALKQVSPINILQHHIKIKPQWHILSIVLSGILLCVLVALWVGESDIALKMGMQIALMSLVALALGYSLWLAFSVLSRYGPLAWRFGIAYMVRHKWHSITQWVVFTLVLSLLFLIRFIQQDIYTWQAQLPPDTPNYFLLNVSSNEVDNLKKWLNTRNIAAVHFYPIVRGRLSHINGASIDLINQTATQVKGLSRPINLTWMRNLPSNNHVISGTPWDQVKEGEYLISVEKKFSERQELKLGDTLTFQIGEQTVSARISQLRTVQWESFHPNFFVIFPPQTLETFPHTYMTSFYLPPAQKIHLTSLIKEHAQVSVIDIDEVLQKIRTMIGKVALVLQILLLMVFVTGIFLMYTCLIATIKERCAESALLQILGGHKVFIAKILMIEFSVMGLLSGLAASLLAFMLAYGLNEQFFERSVIFDASWLVLGLTGGMVIVLFGLFGTRRVFKVSPLQLLKQNG